MKLLCANTILNSSEETPMELVCNSQHRGCAGDRAEMVVKVYCGTVLGDEFAAMLKYVPHNSPTMHFDNHLEPVSSISKWQ